MIGINGEILVKILIHGQYKNVSIKRIFDDKIIHPSLINLPLLFQARQPNLIIQIN